MKGKMMAKQKKSSSPARELRPYVLAHLGEVASSAADLHNDILRRRLHPRLYGRMMPIWFEENERVFVEKLRHIEEGLAVLRKARCL